MPFQKDESSYYNSNWTEWSTIIVLVISKEESVKDKVHFKLQACFIPKL